MFTFMEKLLINKVELQPSWQANTNPEEKATTVEEEERGEGESKSHNKESFGSAREAQDVNPPTNSFLAIVQRTEEVTDRRNQLLRLYTEGFESDSTREEAYERCLPLLENGLEVRELYLCAYMCTFPIYSQD